MNAKAFKSARKKDINDYLGIISKYGITHGKIDHKEFLADSHWGYEIKSLKFSAETSTLKHIRPPGFTSVDVIVDLNLESQIEEWANLNDPFTNLNFRSILKGTNAKTQKIHYLGFHIDRHNGSTTNEIHPLYHLQYLQNVNSLNEFDHGESLQLDLPRMMHFPMELILGVSFLLASFSPNTYKKLLSDRQYINLGKEYQKRVWRPYINSLENFWTSNANHWQWNPQLNCPYLV